MDQYDTDRILAELKEMNDHLGYIEKYLKRLDNIYVRNRR